MLVDNNEGVHLSVQDYCKKEGKGYDIVMELNNHN